MNICNECLEYSIPECVESLTFTFGFVLEDPYIVVFENHFGTKIKFDIDSDYAGSLTIIAEDFPDGYFFRGNIISVKFYTTQENYQCDSPMELCDTNICLTLKVQQIETEILDVTLECC